MSDARRGRRRTTPRLLAVLIASHGCTPQIPRGDAEPIAAPRGCVDACATEALRAVVAALEAGDRAAAQRRFDALTPTPSADNAEARWVRALLSLESGDLDAARAHARWLSTHPTTAALAVRTARLLVRLDDAPRAAAFLVGLTEARDVESPALYEELATVRRGLGQEDAAERALRAGLARTPDDRGLLEQLAGTRAQRGDPREALTLYTRALTLAPERPELHEAVARLATSVGDHPLAIEHARRAVTLAGDDTPRLFLVWSAALAASGDADAARRALEEGRRRHPHDEGLRRGSP